MGQTHALSADLTVVKNLHIKWLQFKFDYLIVLCYSKAKLSYVCYYKEVNTLVLLSYPVYFLEETYQKEVSN